MGKQRRLNAKSYTYKHLQRCAVHLTADKSSIKEIQIFWMSLSDFQRIEFSVMMPFILPFASEHVGSATTT